MTDEGGLKGGWGGAGIHRVIFKENTERGTEGDRFGSAESYRDRERERQKV